MEKQREIKLEKMVHEENESEEIYYIKTWCNDLLDVFNRFIKEEKEISDINIKTYKRCMRGLNKWIQGTRG